MPAPVSDCCC